jgi:hypothetical protein
MADNGVPWLQPGPAEPGSDSSLPLSPASSSTHFEPWVLLARLRR